MLNSFWSWRTASICNMRQKFLFAVSIVKRDFSFITFLHSMAINFKCWAPFVAYQLYSVRDNCVHCLHTTIRQDIWLLCRHLLLSIVSSLMVCHPTQLPRVYYYWVLRELWKKADMEKLTYMCEWVCKQIFQMVNEINNLISIVVMLLLVRSSFNTFRLLKLLNLGFLTSLFYF